MRRAICLGINRYEFPLQPLRGCVHDAQAWAQLLADRYGFDDVRVLLDADVTRDNLLGVLDDAIAVTTPDDRLTVTFSGHGMSLPDAPPLDELDGRDEAWQAFDGTVRDDDLAERFARLPEGARLYLISDCCHAGTVHRGRAHGRRRTQSHAAPPFPCCRAPQRRPVRGSADAMVGQVLLAGCADDEDAYEITYRGQRRGALSAFAIGSLRARPQQTWEELYARLRQRLPSVRRPQTPQLLGDPALLVSPVFE